MGIYIFGNGCACSARVVPLSLDRRLLWWPRVVSSTMASKAVPNKEAFEMSVMDIDHHRHRRRSDVVSSCGWI